MDMNGDSDLGCIRSWALELLDKDICATKLKYISSLLFTRLVMTYHVYIFRGDPKAHWHIRVKLI